MTIRVRAGNSSYRSGCPGSTLMHDTANRGCDFANVINIFFKNYTLGYRGNRVALHPIIAILST